MPTGMIGTMISQFARGRGGAVERRVVVLPHLDLRPPARAASPPRWVTPLLYENPELVWLGFKDPSFPLPKVIDNLFPHRVSLLGIGRHRLRDLITCKESRKFGREFNPWALYKYVSGINAVRLRRLLSTLEGEDYPADPGRAFRQLRQATLGGTLEVPTVSLDQDIGGYAKVKERLRPDVLDVLACKEELSNEEQIRAMEELIPKGMIFWGPPGTGKTLFAKAIAAEIGAAVTVVSGPELKSKWVGESEEISGRSFIRPGSRRRRSSCSTSWTRSPRPAGLHRLRRRAFDGQPAPTEMDGFHREEMVFVVGTTNFVSILDPALLRPGRFEFHLHIPYPDAEARREIIRIYDRKMGLKMTPETLEDAVDRTDHVVPGAAAGTLFSGDHLNALCRAVARKRLGEGRTDETRPEDVEKALSEWVDRKKLNAHEEKVIATHEAGHAVYALLRPRRGDQVHCAERRPDGRRQLRPPPGPGQRRGVDLKPDVGGICVAFGGREAEQLFFGDVSWGCSQDLHQATQIARHMVERYGMGGPDVGTVSFPAMDPDGRWMRGQMSPAAREIADRRIREILDEGRRRAAAIVKENRELIDSLRDLLIEKRVIEAKVLQTMTAGSSGKSAAAKANPPWGTRFMAEMTIRLIPDPATGKKKSSSPGSQDALPHPQEQMHRALVEKLVNGGLLKAEEVGQIVVEGEEKAPAVPVETGPQGERQARKQGG